MRARIAGGLLVCASIVALAGCAGAPAGRLGAEGSASATASPGAPVEVLNTTTTGPPRGDGTATTGSAGMGPGSSGTGAALGLPGGGSGAGSGQSQGKAPGQNPGASGASTGSGSQDEQIRAMVTCLKSKGIDVPPPRTDASGNVVYDQAALSALSQDPEAQAAAEACAAQVGIGTN